MPKLAREYNNNDYFSPTYNNLHLVDFTQNDIQKPRKRKKKSLLRLLFSSFLLFFFAIFILGYSFNGFTGALFNPKPYKNIKTDLHDVAFPINNYLSNSWFMGERSFRYAADSKHALMTPLSMNVEMPVLKNDLLYLMEIYPQIKPAIFVWDYETQNYIDINGTKTYSAASIIKIPVLIDLFKSIEAGQVSLDDEISLTEYFRTEGSGNLQFKAENSLWTVDELANRMITDSDNSATNMLMTRIGSMTDVNQAIRDWGLNNTEIKTWLPDLSGNNRTTAKDIAQMIYNIDENDRFLSESSRSKILDYMSHVHNNRLIQAGLGEGAIFFHKTGDIGKMLGDAGLVITPNGKKFIVVILANRPHNSFAGKEFIVKASEIIYSYMVR